MPKRLGLACLALALALSAARIDAATAGFELKVKPSLCIVDSRNRNCRMTILVEWTAAAAGAYCLHSELAAGPLGCWSDHTTGRLEDDRVVEARLRYWLAHDGSEDAIAEASIDVMNAEPSDRRQSRLRRHAWSIL